MSSQGQKERRVASQSCSGSETLASMLGSGAVFKARFGSRFAFVILAMIMVGAIGTPGVRAQGYPSKPVRVVVPNTAGSLIDVLTRLVIPAMSNDLGQPFYAENLAGAAGGIGTENVAKAAPDGYTLLAGDVGAITINPAIYTKLGYDPVRDLSGISMLGKTSYVLLVNPSLGVKTLDEFIKLVKSRPGQINYSSGGNGHPQHMLMEIFQQAAGTQLYHIPYKGGPAALQALISGDVGANIVGIADARSHIQSGRVIPLAIGGPRIQGVLPDVPDLVKFFPGFTYAPWFAMFAPAGTPPEVVGKLNAAMVKTLDSAGLRQKMAELGLTVAASSPAEVEQLVRTDLVRNRDLVKRMGMKID